MSEYKIAIKIAGKIEKSLGQALKGTSSQLKLLGQVGKISAAGLTAAGTAVAAMTAASIKTGKEFETQMAATAATAGATAEEYDRLKQAAMEMGRTTSKTATESAAALEYMALAGWNVDQSIKGLPGVLRLSEATSLDLARTSDLVTDSMAALGLTVDDLSGYLDICAKANNKSNQTAEQLMEAYIGVGGTMKNLNVPTTESATALGVLANRGIKGAEAGTALNAILINLTSGAGASGKAMQELGLSAFDSAGNFKGMRNVLGELNTKLKGMTEEQRNATLAAIGGKHHVDALNDLLSGLNATTADGALEWDALTNELENANGALEKMAAMKMDNLEGDMLILKSAFDDLKIHIYDGMEAPLRGAAQAGTEAIYQLTDAYASGGVAGLVEEIGTVFAEGLSSLANHAPEFIEMGVNAVVAFLDGIDSNSGEIGAGEGRIVTALADGLVRIGPKLIVVGGKLLVELGKGIIENLPELGAAGKEAIKYLLEEMKNALKNYLSFLSDDTVSALSKVASVLPIVLGGFLAFRKIAKLTGKLKGFTNGFNPLNKILPGTGKGIEGLSTQMSSFSKNVLGAGAGFGLAAAGLWLIADAATKISQAGPEATAHMIGMVGSVAMLLAIAANVGPQLDVASNGLIAFGGAVLMAAAGMSLMAFASVQMAQAGPLALGAFVLMAGGMAGLLAIAGAMGPQLATASGGLIAFGGAVLMASAGMALMAFSATQLAQAGPLAVGAMALLIGGMAGLMAIAALLGPQLTAAGIGLIAFGAGITLAATGCMILAQAAIALGNAGAPAQIAMALMAAGILAFGAAAGALAPLILAGAGAVAALGAALLVVSTAAMVGAGAIAIISTALPSLAQYGLSGSAALLTLGASLVVFGAGATVGGAGAVVAAAGLLGLAGGAIAASVAMLPLSAEMVLVATSVRIIAASAKTAGTALKSMASSTTGIIAKMAKLAVGLVPATAAFVPFAAAALAASVAMTALMVTTTGTATGFILMNAGIVGVVLGLQLLNVGVTMFNASANSLQNSMTMIGTSSAGLASEMPALGASFLMIIAPSATASASVMAFAVGMAASVASAVGASAAIMGIVAVFGAMAAGVSASMNIVTASVGNSTSHVTMMISSSGSMITASVTATGAKVAAVTMMTSNKVKGQVSSSSTQIIAVVATSSSQLVAVISSSGAQAVNSARSTANGIYSAFASMSLYSAGAYMMQGLMNGLESRRYQVMNTAASIARAASTSINNSLQIHSPSKVTTESGMFTGEGLVVGMVKSASAVSKAGEKLGNTASAGISKQMAEGQRIASAIPTEPENVRNIDKPVVEKTSVFREVINRFSNDGPKTANEGKKEEGTTIIFSPTYKFEGDAPSKKDVMDANRMSQREFERYMKEYLRGQNRTQFG